MSVKCPVPLTSDLACALKLPSQSRIFFPRVSFRMVLVDNKHSRRRVRCSFVLLFELENTFVHFPRDFAGIALVSRFLSQICLQILEHKDTTPVRIRMLTYSLGRPNLYRNFMWRIVHCENFTLRFGPKNVMPSVKSTWISAVLYLEKHSAYLL